MSLFGSNINTPSVLIDQLLVLEAATTSEMVKNKVKCLTCSVENSESTEI